MKRIGFLLSLLVHLLFVLLAVNVRFNVNVYRPPQRVIAVVPMSPPLKFYKPLPSPAVPPPPQGRAPVFIRPFIIPGGNRGGTGSGGGDGERAGGMRTQPGSPAGNKPAGEPALSSGKGKKEGDQSLEAKPKTGRLSIDWDEISRRLAKRKLEQESPPPAFGSGHKLTMLPFSEYKGIPGLGPGEGGDGVTAVGGSAFFDSRGYDITPWAKRLVYRIKKNWIFPLAVEYGMQGTVEIYLMILKDGSVRDLEIKKSSWIRPFDQSALNALELSSPFPPLPYDFPNRDLPVYFIFRFN